MFTKSTVIQNLIVQVFSLQFPSTCIWKWCKIFQWTGLSLHRNVMFTRSIVNLPNYHIKKSIYKSYSNVKSFKFVRWMSLNSGFQQRWNRSFVYCTISSVSNNNKKKNTIILSHRDSTIQFKTRTYWMLFFFHSRNLVQNLPKRKNAERKAYSNF